MTVRADLHIHSCLSPCGSLSSSPSAIAVTAAEKGLDLIALTDHNTSLNSPAFAQACLQNGIEPVFGMEATTMEEAHCLCLFARQDVALEFSEFIDSRIHKVPNNPERMGDQVIVDIDETVTGTVDHLLISATDLSLEDMESRVHQRGGLFIPAHVDRGAFSLSSQLGFIPKGKYDALEWYHPDNPEKERYAEYPALTNSDAHQIEDIGRRSFSFESESADFNGLRDWLHSLRI